MSNNNTSTNDNDINLVKEAEDKNKTAAKNK